jgi:hypothetical protein
MKILTRLSTALVLSIFAGVSAGAAVSDAISVKRVAYAENVAPESSNTNVQRLQNPKAVSAVKKATQPIELVVTDDPRSLDSKYYYYNFGSVTVHYRESADFVFRNRSSSSVYFNNITVSGSAYRAYSGCPYRLSPGSSCVTRVDFVPWYEGYHYGRLGFWYNGGNIIIDLQGYGRSW